MINLDDESGYATCTTSAGGMNVLLDKEIIRIQEKMDGYRLSIKGLAGGHSGAEIDKERGNANKLLVRILYGIMQHFGLQLAQLKGGLMDNAIPREASALWISDGNSEKIEAYVKAMAADIKKELEFSDAGVQVILEKTQIDSYVSVEES